LLNPGPGEGKEGRRVDSFCEEMSHHTGISTGITKNSRIDASGTQANRTDSSRQKYLKEVAKEIHLK
jgi:hypothetical protein